MSTNIQLPKVATSVSFCDSEEAPLIPPTSPGAGAGAGADTLLDVPDSAREAIRASSSLPSQLAIIFQGHCNRADSKQSLSTPQILFQQALRRHLVRSFRSLAIAWEVKRSNGQTDTSKKKARKVNRNFSEQTSLYKNTGWNASTAPPQSVKALAIRILRCTQGAHNAWPTGGPWLWPSFTVTHKNMEYVNIE